ncbi:TPT-domain-containing protein [Ascodesmis nigricans]|uniref:TPT-domain-containing protein n=1 Tax=Ascodesmis nigricans TaxID=341454 RepID=A0A4S2MJL2_9PEZI|nr:TPT-domain-containing protein [Ascodesmis nigricans]
MEGISLRNTDEEESHGFLERPRSGQQHSRGEDDVTSLLSDKDDSDDEGITKDEKKKADMLVIRNILINVALIGLWYIFSLSISVYNKWMFAPDKLNLNFPLFISSVHMLVQFSLSMVVLYFVPQFRPAGLFGHQADADSTTPLSRIAEPARRETIFRWNTPAEEQRKRENGEMTNRQYLTQIAPCGAATGLDIGLGNMSLKFISLAFYTMCKSSSLAFVLLFAFAFRLEKVTVKLVSIIAVMTLGVVMMVASEAQFILTGFFLVILASALSGLRWSLTQMLLLHNPATGNPFSSIFYLAPCMFAAIFIIAIPVEGLGPLFAKLGQLSDEWGVVSMIGLVLFPGIIAFLMVSAEFALLKRSSVVTLSICGIFKEVITISAAAYFFDDPLTPLNISGLIVTIISIAAYNYIKISRMRQDAHRIGHAQAHPHHHPVRPTSNRVPSLAGYAGVDEDDYEDEDHHFSAGGSRVQRLDTRAAAASSLSPSDISVSPSGALPRASVSQRLRSER